MQILMISMSDAWSDARVSREAAELARAGHEVVIVGRGASGRLRPGVEVAGVATGAGLHTVGSDRLPRTVRRMGRWMLLPEHRTRVEQAFRDRARVLARELSFDVIHAHDFVALPLAVELRRERRVPLVYDSHECWTGRRLVGRPTPVALRRTRSLERALGAQADEVITVSAGIAQWFRDEYGWSHTTVVRNTFPPATDGASRPHGPVRGVVYAGRLGGRRDLETLAAAADRLDGLAVDLMGHLDEDFARTFRPGRANVHPPVAIDEVDERYRRAGLAAVPLADDCLNHRLALPNKVFHAVRAGVPVVAADLPALRRLVLEHELGTLYRPGDPASFASAVMRAVDAVDHHRQRVVEAQGELSWDVDSRELRRVYGRLPANP